MNKFVSRKEFSIVLILIIAYFILAIAALDNNALLHILGCAIYFSVILFSDIEYGLYSIILMSPNIALVVINNNGFGLFGLAYLIILIKKSIFNMDSNKIFIVKRFIPVCIYLMVISFLRITNSNYYDFIAISQIIVGIIVWENALRDFSERKNIKVIQYFEIGCILMIIGMILQYLYHGGSNSRLSAILDDPNYTGCVLCVLLTITLLVYCYKLSYKYNLLIMFISLLMGLLTGSRGFLISVVCVVIMFSFIGVFSRREKKIIVLAAIGICAFFVMYALGIEVIVSIYDNTIGRTISLRESYNVGDFMDITSGRMLLWAHYINKIFSSIKTLSIGDGFFQYYLVSNGGNGLAAHNAYISSVVGLGVIGAIMLIVLYTRFITSRIKFSKKYIAYLSIIVGVLVDYFFLDGILDLRLITYFVIVICLINTQTYYDDNTVKQLSRI